MTDLYSALSILNLLGLGGLGLFIYYIVKGLRERIASLTQLAEEQNKTLKTVQKRAKVAEDIIKDYRDLGMVYKNAHCDLQEMHERFNTQRNKLIAELQEENQRKDQKIVQSMYLQLEKIEVKAQSIDKIFELETELEKVLTGFKQQLQILSRNTESFGPQTNAGFYKFKLPDEPMIDGAVIGLNHPLITKWKESALAMIFKSKGL